MYKLKQDESEARERLRAFWRGESIGRPGLLAYARNTAFAPEPWRGPELSRKQQDFNPEWQTLTQCNAMRSRIYLAEAMPAAHVSIGGLLTLLAVLAGGDYEYHDSAWIQPREGVLDAPVPKFDPECEVVRKLTACVERLVGEVGGDGLVSPPVMLDAMTTLSMFLNPDRLCLALMEEPEKVKRWTRDATALYIDCIAHFARLLNGLGHTGSVSWLGIYSEGVMEAVQCDFAVMLSPEMFDEFVMPDLRRTTAALDDSIYHLDGVEQMRFIGQIASSPKMRAIQWNPARRVAPSDDLPHFKRVREHGLSLFVNVGSVDDAVYLTRELGADGLMLGLPFFEREEDAREAIARIARAS